MSKIKRKCRPLSWLPLLALLLLSVPTFSSVFAPDWRGDEKTVYAEWANWGYTNNLAGDYLFNPDLKSYGAGVRTSINPQAVQLSSLLTGNPVQVLSMFDNHSNVLKLNDDGLYVNLPNFTDDEHTLVRFEISYYTQFSQFSGFNVWAMSSSGTLPGYNGNLIVPQLVESSTSGFWKTAVYEFTITPSPRWENLVLNFSHYPAVPYDIDCPYIDSFSFDTICIPEPATVMLLAMGGLFLRKRR